MEIRDPLGAFRASALYTHTYQPQGGTFLIYAGTLGNPAYTSVQIGRSRTTEGTGCLFSAPHLHQYGEDFTNRNTSRYPNAPATGTYSVSDITNWINSDSYSWNQ